MIKSRIALNLHFHFSSSLRNSSPYLPQSLSSNSYNCPRFKRIEIAFCSQASVDFPVVNDKIFLSSGEEPAKATTWIVVATLISKILGFLREVSLASVFGLGPVATAFKYAWVLPGFTSCLLGGVNGPIHIIMAATLSKLPKDRGNKLFQQITTIIFLAGGVIGGIVYAYPEFIIHTYAPGLWILAEGQIIRKLAIEQLKILIPCLVLAGPVGLGYGYMSAEGNHILPIISPAFSSFLLIVCCLSCIFSRRLSVAFPGGSLVAAGVSLGLFIQWIFQVMVLKKKLFKTIPDSQINVGTSQDVSAFFSLLFPATISSGFSQIASCMDVCFASVIPRAAASLSYANLMVMAPLGALSSIIVPPLVPIFSKLVKTSSWEKLTDSLTSSVLLCMVVVMPILCSMCILVKPIVAMVFECFGFDSSAADLVSDLFLAYSLGAPFFIIRDLLVAVFYAFGDGRGPFLVSAGALAFKAILDWLSISRFMFGAQGLALSTSFTAATSVILLSHLLQRKLPGLSNYAEMIYPFILLLFCCISSCFSTSLCHILIRKLLCHAFLLRYSLVIEILALSIAGALGVIGFFLPIVVLHFFGVELVRHLHVILMKQQSVKPAS